MIVKTEVTNRRVTFDACHLKDLSSGNTLFISTGWCPGQNHTELKAILNSGSKCWYIVNNIQMQDIYLQCLTPCKMLTLMCRLLLAL